MMGAYYSVTSAIKQAGEEIRIEKYRFGCTVLSRDFGETVSRQLGNFDRVSHAQTMCRRVRAKRAAWLLTEDDDVAARASDYAIDRNIREAVKAAIA